jgi:hypothetical protein
MNRFLPETRFQNFGKASGPTAQCCTDFRLSAAASNTLGIPGGCASPTCGKGTNSACISFHTDTTLAAAGIPTAQRPALYGKPVGCVNFNAAPACTTINEVTSECDCYNLDLSNRNETESVCRQSQAGVARESLFGGGTCQFNCAVPQCNDANSNCDDTNLTNFECSAAPLNAQFECTYGSVS